MNVRPSASLLDDIFPLFAVRQGDGEGVSVVSFAGTGFLVAPELLVTCWHCVRDELPDGHHYAAARVESNGTWGASRLVDLAQDTNGSDLATATVKRGPVFGLRPAGDVPFGTDVFTFGFPLTKPPTKENPRWALGGRFLQGYVARDFYFESAEFGRVPSYELDMPTPAGLSGAPLMRVGEASEVVGVIYGSHGVAQVESWAEVDPETGNRTPQVEQVVTFGLAHHAPTLLDLRGPATDDRRLEDYVADANREVDPSGLYPAGEWPPQPSGT